jgi:hypothetical protein
MAKMATAARASAQRNPEKANRPWTVRLAHGFAAVVYGLVLRVCLFTMVACVVILPLTIALPHHLEQQSVYVQRVVVDPELAVLTGAPGVPIGGPATIVLSNREALLDGVSPDGARWVDHSKLGYPVQLKTVVAVCRGIQIWATSAGVAALLVFLLLRGHLDRPRKADAVRAEAMRRRHAGSSR